MKNKLLHDEIRWITKNQHRYDSKLHAQSVIGNITKRYRIAELEKKLKEATK